MVQVNFATLILRTMHIYLCFTRSYPLASFSLLSYALLIYFSGSSKNVSSSTKVIYEPFNQSYVLHLSQCHCLKDITRKDRTSHTNGVVAVIMKVDNSYEWFK